MADLRADHGWGCVQAAWSDIPWIGVEWSGQPAGADGDVPPL